MAQLGTQAASSQRYAFAQGFPNDETAENAYDDADLSRVEEIGFTDLMRGAGHGSGGGSRVDWIQVTGKPVPRAASRTANTAR